MKKVFRHIQAAALVIMCAGCSKTAIEEHASDRSTELSLSISAGCEGKAIFTGTSLAEGSEVGAALFGTDGNTYDGVKYENIRYLAKGAYPAQSWDPDMSIMLSASKATLYTYYPYSNDVNSLKSIPVRTAAQSILPNVYLSTAKNLVGPVAFFSFNAARISFWISHPSVNLIQCGTGSF